MFWHSLHLAGRNWRSYAFLSVTIFLSFTLLLGFFSAMRKSTTAIRNCFPFLKS